MKKALHIGILVTGLALASSSFAEDCVDCTEDVNKMLNTIEEEMKPNNIDSIKYSGSLNMTDEYFQCVAESIEKSTNHKYSLEEVADSPIYYVIEKRKFYKAVD